MNSSAVGRESGADLASARRVNMPTAEGRGIRSSRTAERSSRSEADSMGVKEPWPDDAFRAGQDLVSGPFLIVCSLLAGSAGWGNRWAESEAKYTGR